MDQAVNGCPIKAPSEPAVPPVFVIKASTGIAFRCALTKRNLGTFNYFFAEPGLRRKPSYATTVSLAWTDTDQDAQSVIFDKWPAAPHAKEHFLHWRVHQWQRQAWFLPPSETARGVKRKRGT